MPTVTVKDGTKIYYKDWGSGKPVVFSHGWPLSADAFEDQMMYLASRGYRCIAHDRRGHGCSDQPWTGYDYDTFADVHAAMLADRSQFWRDIAVPFYGANRPGAKVSQGVIDSFWLQGCQASFKGTYDCVQAYSETDFTEDLKAFNVPTLILHGDDDQIVPIAASAVPAAKLVEYTQLVVYEGAPHGMCTTLKDRVNRDLLAFLTRGKVETADSARHVA